MTKTFICTTCNKEKTIQDTNWAHIFNCLWCLGWTAFKSEGQWQYMCTQCNQIPKSIDEDDEYDNLKDNELSLTQDSQREGN